MRKRMAVIISVMLLTMVCAPALAGHGVYHIDYTDEAPREVVAHYSDKWPGYVLEDYLHLEGMEPDVGLALVEKGGHRVLSVYRDRGKGMTYWYSTDRAMPQGKGEAWFETTGEQVFEEGFDWTHVADHLGFSVTRYDLLGDSYNQYVTYRWRDGGFHLISFCDMDESIKPASVEEGKLSYYDEGELQGSVCGDIQTDLRYANFAALPKTLNEARWEITSAPSGLPVGDILFIDGGQLIAREISPAQGRNYPVYTGPGQNFARSGNGKGSVSTNDWIQVFGQYDGWIMIQYDISAEQYRIGWIEAPALPDGAYVPEVDLYIDHEDYNSVVDPCILTDDPFNSRTAIAQLEVGMPLCELVYDMGGWSYVRVTIDGKTMCGFVPSNCINHG